MKIIPIPALSDNYIWLIIHENQVTCIDPGEARPVHQFLTQNHLALNTIILTHHHYDHIGGTAELLQLNPKINVFAPEDSRIPHVTHVLSEHHVLKLGSLQFKILATPGHTSTHICLYEPNRSWLFCGDTLFSAGCGRVFDGTLEDLHNSLEELKKLPDTTQVYCAHEYTLKNLNFAAIVEPDNEEIQNYTHKLLNQQDPCSLPSSIALEKQINPFLRTQVERVKEYAKLKGCKDDNSLSVFKQIRAEKDKF